MMSQAIQNRQAAGPTAAIEFQMLPVQLSPVRASNSCRTDSAAMGHAICRDVQEDQPACKLSHNSVKDMLRLLCRGTLRPI